MSGFYGEAAAELIVGWDGDVRWVCYCIIMWELLYGIWVTAFEHLAPFGESNFIFSAVQRARSRYQNGGGWVMAG